jgi:hypothetical protein
MNREKACHNFIEEITGSKNLTSECRAHIASCAGCREMARSLEGLKKEASAYRPERFARQKQDIMQRILAVPAPVAETSITTWLETLFTNSFGKWALSCAVVLLGLGLLFFRGGADPAEIPLNPDQILISHENGSQESRPLQLAFETNPGFSKITCPDGSYLEVTGSARLTVQKRGFSLTSGRVTAHVKPGATTFVADTPHGNVVVLGTVFALEVSSGTTSVQLISGSVKLVEVGKPETILTPGQTALLASVVLPEPIPASGPQNTTSNLQGE